MPYQDLSEYRRSARTASLCGHSIAYWVSRKENAKTLLFIHGFPSAAWDWYHQWQFFAPDYQLVALDLLGFGLSDKPYPHNYSVLEQADIIAELVKHLDLKRVNIVAHDYGDTVAQELLAREQQQSLGFDIESLLWLNGGLFAESHRPLPTQTLLNGWLGPIVSRLMSKSSLANGFSRIFGPQSQPKQDEIDTLWTLLCCNKGKRVIPRILDYMKERQRYRQRWVDAMQDAMQKASSKSADRYCFINGVHDPISGKHMLAQFQQMFPDTPTVPLEVGHYPQLEAPQQVNQAIQAIIQSK